MSERRLERIAAVFCVAISVALPTFAAADSMPVHELKHHTHVHGLAVDQENPENVLIATHHGIFRMGPDGQAARISPVKDFMGFTPHPTEPRTYFGSGHPPEGGNLGLILSTDGGVTWDQRSTGANGPVDFHQLTVSPVDPNLIYGAYGGLQRSSDGGHNWHVVGALPADVISMAASSLDSDILYAGTKSGLMATQDGGRSWQALLDGPPVSLVATAEDARLFVFILGQGLAIAKETELQFSLLATDWADEVLLHIALDPNNPTRMFAASHQSNLFGSVDGGVTWGPVRGSAD